MIEKKVKEGYSLDCFLNQYFMFLFLNQNPSTKIEFP